MKMTKVSIETNYKFNIVATKDAVRDAFDNAGLILTLREAMGVIRTLCDELLQARQEYKNYNGKKVEISYHKAFKMVSDRVMQMLGENTDENTTFEPPKEPVDKGKTPAFADVHPNWLRG